MAEQIKIELTPQAEAILRDLQTLPEWGLQAVARGMDQANKLVLRAIQRDHLTGQGPFPVDEHKLGVVSQELRTEAWASKSVITGQSVESAIGDPVKYAGIHEFGGVIHRPARSGKVKLRTDATGKLMRQAAHDTLAVFAGKRHKRFKEVDYQMEAKDIEMPERAPFRTGIAENLDIYTRKVSQALVEEWNSREAA